MRSGPIIIVASRGSRGSLLAALLGAHPELYGAPHLNVLAFQYGWQQTLYCETPRDSNSHGLLRFLAQALCGEQTIQSVQAARRWLGNRAEHSSREIYSELTAMAAPRRLVEYGPLYGQNAAVMRRVIEAFPGARLVHLVSSPTAQARRLSQGVSQTVASSMGYWANRALNQPCMDILEIGEQFVDWSTVPAVFDPQFAWYRTQKAALELFSELPRGQWVRVRVEDIQADPRGTVSELLTALEIGADDTVIEAMLADSGSDFTMPGPFETPAGIDFDMIGSSVAEALRDLEFGQPIDSSAGLPWRGDGDRFVPQVLDLARQLGYQVN